LAFLKLNCRQLGTEAVETVEITVTPIGRDVGSLDLVPLSFGIGSIMPDSTL